MKSAAAVSCIVTTRSSSCSYDNTDDVLYYSVLFYSLL
jgi:hypothetical protein